MPDKEHSDERPLDLPLDLHSRLTVLIADVKEFWTANRHIDYIFKQGPEHSERIHIRRLTDLAEALKKEGISLNAEERFILCAAAWLYEVGMQSTRLEQVLGPEFRSLTLNDLQKEEIRRKRHLLTYDLLHTAAHSTDSIKGLPGRWDDFLEIIALLCKSCSPNPEDQIDSVPETRAVKGVEIRTRLLTATLRLADRLDIDANRVDMDKLKDAAIPLAAKVHWWVYHYTQVLPIESGMIRFFYQVPFSQRQYSGHIRAIVENLFENDPLIMYLLQAHRVPLSLHPRPGLSNPEGILKEMDDEIIGYLRQITPRKFEEIPVVEERPLFLLDYETLILQMGEEGYFFTRDQLRESLIKLMLNASSQYYGVLQCVTFGDWERPDMADARDLMANCKFELVSIKRNSDRAAAVQQVVGLDLEDDKTAHKALIFVAPHESLAPIIGDTIQHRRSVSTWITTHKDASIMQLFKPFKKIPDLLELNPPKAPLSAEEQEANKIACILHLWNKELTGDKLWLGDVEATLAEIERLGGPAHWWRLWLISQGIARLSQEAGRTSVTLDKEHPLVNQVRNRTFSTITTARGSATEQMGTPASRLAASLPHSVLDDTPNLSVFMELLRETGVLICHPEDDCWFVNEESPIVIEQQLDYHLPLFIIAVDHEMVENGRNSLRQDLLAKSLFAYLGSRTTEIVYRQALARDIVHRRATGKQHAITNQEIIQVVLNMNNEVVLNTLRNRNILFDVLYRQHNGLERTALIKRLKDIEPFTAPTEQVTAWLGAFLSKHLIEVRESTDGNPQETLVLNLDHILVQRLLGRNNLYGLVKNLRIMKATQPDRAVPSADVKKNMAQFTTRGDSRMADWTVEYGKIMQLVATLENGDGMRLYLNKHSFVHNLDRRERTLPQQVADLVKRLQGKRTDVPRNLVEQHMSKDILTYGHTREEHAYWIDQAIHRYKLLKETYIDEGGESGFKRKRQSVLTLNR